MAVDRVQRRMAAILAADVVGYSRLMGKDEEDTLATLKVYRSVIDGLIADHAGRIFGSAGDSVIAEFASPVEAVRCATEIQLEIDKRNADLPEASRMRFRIGINLGDVVVDGDNLMGDGVNVAARLEALSPPGGICISEAIHAQVRDRLSLDFLDLGEHKVKNIARPVRAYRVPLASEEQVKSPFRGLDVFDFDHADIFFGRARADRSLRRAAGTAGSHGNAFLADLRNERLGQSLRCCVPGCFRRSRDPGQSPASRSGAAACSVPRRVPMRSRRWRRDCFAKMPSRNSRRDRTATELADLLRGAPDRAPGIDPCWRLARQRRPPA